MIEFQDICLRLGRRFALKGFSLRVQAGKLSLLAGPNGAGKSSCLKVACAFWRPCSGKVLVNGSDITGNSRKAARRVSYLPQSPGFHGRLRVDEIVEFYAALEKQGAGEAEVAIERFGLKSHAHEFTATLSGGLRQRLGLAVLSLSSAPVLLLDEPGLSLDPLWRSRLQAWLREEVSSGRTVLVATHLLAEWEGRSDFAFLCEEGQVAGELDPQSLRGACLRPIHSEERRVSHA